MLDIEGKLIGVALGYRVGEERKEDLPSNSVANKKIYIYITSRRLEACKILSPLSQLRFSYISCFFEKVEWGAAAVMVLTIQNHLRRETLGDRLMPTWITSSI
jgi:hypothetical protein